MAAQIVIKELLYELNPWWSQPGARRGIPASRRDLQPVILSAAGEVEDRRAHLILGPRQVGKTTLLLQVANDLLDGGVSAHRIVFFDFSDDRIPDGISLSPREVVEALPPTPAPSPPRILLLDEVCRARNWDRWLKQVVDQAAFRVVATDSAAFILRDRSRQSGVGRWDEHALEGMSFPEFLRLLARQGESEVGVVSRVPNALSRYLAIGGFPEQATREIEVARRRLRIDIADRAIRRDIGQLHPDVDIEQVRRLFVHLVQNSGDIFDGAKRAVELDADRRSVRSWLRLIEDTGLVVRLERWTRGSRTTLLAKPKLYAADSGLIAAFSVVREPLEDDSVRSRLWEAAVFRHLRQVVSPDRIRYFREKNDLEIDFVTELDDGFTIAVEVTTSAIPARRKIARLRAAAERAHAIPLLVCGTADEAERDGVRLVSLRRFLFDTAEVLRSAR